MPFPVLVEELRKYLLSKWFGKRGRSSHRTAPQKQLVFSLVRGGGGGWGGAHYNGLYGETPS